jgi:hypothetical protein
MPLSLSTVLFIENYELAFPGHNDHAAVSSRGKFDLFKSYYTRITRFKRCLLRSTRCRSTDMERSHRQLSTRLPDRLSRDNTDRFPDIYEVPTS